MPLTPRQMRFAQEYAIDFNATAAAIRVGYSRQSAGVQAHKLLKNAEIRAAVEAAKAQSSDFTGLTKERLAKELWLAFGEARADKHHAGTARIGELLARMHAYIPEPERRVRIIRELGDLSDDELTTLAAAVPLTIEGSAE